jgi:TolB-like protein
MGIWLLPRLFHHAPPPSPPSGSLAVLPFNPATASAADGQLADALTADLTSALQRGMQWAPVVSPNLALTYKGKGFDARALGRELNIRYVVEGEVRTVGDQVVVKARLTETGNGTEVWSGDVGLEQARIAKERSDLVARLTVQVNNALLNVERRRILAQPLANASATDLALRADAIQQIDAVGSLTTMAEARKLYDAALRLDPNMPAALMGQALTVAGRLDLDPRTNRDALVREYEEMSARLVAVAGGEARAWNIRADALQRA